MLSVNLEIAIRENVFRARALRLQMEHMVRKIMIGFAEVILLVNAAAPMDTVATRKTTAGPECAIVENAIKTSGVLARMARVDQIFQATRRVLGRSLGSAAVSSRCKSLLA
jgi:hypothetical protein